MKFIRLAAATAGAAACALLSACGGDSGSGGGVSSTPPPPASFTSFGNVQSNSSTTVDGSTREGTLSITNNGTLTNISTPTEGSGSVAFTLNSQREATALSLRGASSSVSFNSNSSFFSLYDTSNRPVAVAVENASGSDQAIYADPYVLGFNYQSFGVWGTGLVTGGSGKFGAISVGSKTSGSAVPGSGSATFNGRAGGIYVDANGNPFRYGAYATFAVNFGNRTVNMNTSGDRLWNVYTDAISVPSTPLTASMTYGQGSAAFSGTVQAGSFMTGSGSGSFYGPNANELGGTFFISGSAGKMVGGFGAKQ